MVTWDNFRILLVDDDEVLLSETKELLEVKNASVETAKDGDEAFEKIKEKFYYSERSYDLVISDINMPVMDGLELLEKTKQLNPKILFILLSAHDDFFYLKSAVNLHADDYFRKVDEYEKLIEAVDKMYLTKERTLGAEEEKFFVEQYVKAFNHKQIVMKIGLNGEILEVNHNFLETFGVAREEILHTLARELDFIDITPNFVENAKEKLFNKARFQSVIKCINKRGKEIFVKTWIFPIHSIDKSLHHYYVLAHDVTNIVHQRVIHNSNQQYLNTLFKKIPNLLLLTDTKKLLNLNESFLQFLGYHDLKHFKNHHKCVCEFFIKTKDSIGEDEWFDLIQNLPEDSDNLLYHVRMYDKNQEERLFSVKFSPLHVNSEILVVFTDITLEKRAEEQQLFEQDKLIAMGEMIGNIAHQWRQPLSAISSITTTIDFTMQMDVLDQNELQKQLQDINSLVQYLSKTIDDFRNYLREDKERVLTCPVFIVEDAIKFIKYMYEQLGIKIIINNSLKESCKISCVKNEMIQVLLNILNNAKDAIISNKVDGKIEVFIYKVEEQVIIKIKDNAGGIPKEILNKIFEPYFTTKHKSNGTGIGLYMVASIIKSHNAKIKAYNQSDGAVFELGFSQILCD